MIIGGHVSIRNGYLGAAKQAYAAGMNVFQYFPSNPRQLTIKRVNWRDAQQCAAFCAQREIVSIAHSAYPANLCTFEKAKKAQVIASICNDLEIAASCGSRGVVVHFGRSKAEPLRAYTQMLHTLNAILEKVGTDTLLLIENVSGQHGRMGCTLEELVKMRTLCDAPQRIGFCLDTCHLFASGVWNKNNWETVANSGKTLDYFDHLQALHLNDSHYPSGSLRDKHARIGQGMIGVDALASLIRSAHVKGVPIILETPHYDIAEQSRQVAYIRSLFTT